MASRRRDAARKRGAKESQPRPGRTGRETVDPTMDRLCRLLAEFPKSPRQGLAGFLGGLAALEWSLADLLSTQCEKSKAMTGRISSPMTPDELIEFEKTLAAVLAEIVKVEEILLTNLRLILAHRDMLEDDLFELGDKDDEPCDDEIGEGE